MPDGCPEDGGDEGDIMAGERRIARADTALPDWYASDASYRPIPIVWFAGALILQVIAQPLLVALLWGVFALPGLIVAVCALVASAMIGQFTWQRGMAGAAPAWRALTIAMLAFFFLITALTVLS